MAAFILTVMRQGWAYQNRRQEQTAAVSSHTKAPRLPSLSHTPSTTTRTLDNRMAGLEIGDDGGCAAGGGAAAAAASAAAGATPPHPVCVLLVDRQRVRREADKRIGEPRSLSITPSLLSANNNNSRYNSNGGGGGGRDSRGTRRAHSNGTGAGIRTDSGTETAAGGPTSEQATSTLSSPTSAVCGQGRDQGQGNSHSVTCTRLCCDLKDLRLGVGREGCW